MTFLPASSRHPAPDVLAELLPEVVSDIVEQMFFGSAEPCDAVTLAEFTSAGAQDEWLQVSVSFRGAVGGELEVRLPVDLARTLGCAMMGTGDASAMTSELVDDLAGELANMVCGALLTRADRLTCFHLLPPVVRRTQIGTPAAEGAAYGNFSVNERPMAVCLRLQ